MIEHGPDDEAISVLVDVARSAGRDLTSRQRSRLDELISQGYIESTDRDGEPTAGFAVTPKGQRLLDRRGVGANEA